MDIKKNTSDNTNNYIQIISTSITIVASIAISRWIIIYQENRSRKKIIIDSCNSLVEEIGEINSSLPISDTNNAITILANIDPSPIEKYFPVDSYDSIIHSAHYLQLSKKTKKQLAIFYYRVKTHNKEIINLNRLKDHYHINSDKESIILNQIKLKNKYIIELEGSILSAGFNCIYVLEKEKDLLIRKND